MCETCYGSNDNECLSCDKDLFFNENRCMINCPIGTTGNLSNMICYKIPELTISLADIIDNPYYFLLIFLS